MTGADEARMARGDLTRLVAPVEGWLELEDAWALHEAACACLERSAAPVAVEIGSWKGRSAVALAAAFAAAGRGVLHAVDPHSGTVTHARAGLDDSLGELERNLATAGVAGHVRVIRASSATARAQFGAGPVDLLFVDGSHRYDDVADDLLGWQPLLAAGATVALHDAPVRVGVRRAIDRHVLRAKSGYAAPRLVGDTLLVTWTGRRAAHPGRRRWVRTRLRILRRQVRVGVATGLRGG